MSWTLDPLIAALQGIGYATHLVAAQGLLPKDEEILPTTHGQGTMGLVGYRIQIPQPKPRKRPRKVRERGDWLLFM